MVRNTTHKVIFHGLSAALLAAALVGCGGNNAGDTTTTTTTAPDTTTAAPSATTQNNAATSGNVATNATATGTASSASFKAAAATWKQVAAAKANLDGIIQAGKLKDVHEAAFKVRDIVKTLPAKSSALSPEKQKTLASQVENVAQLAGKLDESGDAGNMAATKENQAGMNDALDILKSVYPAGALG